MNFKDMKVHFIRQHFQAFVIVYEPQFRFAGYNCVSDKNGPFKPCNSFFFDVGNSFWKTGQCLGSLFSHDMQKGHVFVVGQWKG